MPQNIPVKVKKFLLALVAGLALPVLFFLFLFLRTLGTQAVPDTVLTSPNLPRINLNQTIFHSETYGAPDKPVIIVLHDGPGGDYRSLLPLKPLSDQYRLVFYDQRGNGLSARVPDAQLTIDQALKDLDAFVQQYGKGQPVILLGHGWGGMLATAYTGQHPQAIQALILAEPGFLNNKLAAQVLPVMGRTSAGFIWNATLNWIASIHVKGPDSFARNDFVLGRIRPQKLYFCDQKFPQDLVQRYWRAGFKAWKLITQSTFNQHNQIELNLTQGLDQYQGPVLLLASSCNQITGKEFQAHQKPLFQHAELVTIPKSGHDLFWENPSASLKAVRNFLSQVPQTPPSSN